MGQVGTEREISSRENVMSGVDIVANILFVVVAITLIVTLFFG